MSDKYEQYQDEMSQWQDHWDKALQDGTFEPAKTHVPSERTGSDSFFGYTNSGDNPNIKEPDAAYWDSVYKLSKVYSPDEGRSLDDDPHADYLDGDLIQEALEADAKNMANTMLKSPNPIRPESVGKDQDVSNPISVGATYDVNDLEQLEKVKLKLHGLIDKLNGLESNGKSNTKLEQQIAALSKQIDEMSDNLNRCMPNQQGD